MEFAGDFATISGERREMIDCQARMLHIPIKKTGFSSPRFARKGRIRRKHFDGVRCRHSKVRTTFRGNLFELKSLGA